MTKARGTHKPKIAKTGVRIVEASGPEFTSMHERMAPTNAHDLIPRLMRAHHASTPARPRSRTGSKLAFDDNADIVAALAETLLDADASVAVAFIERLQSRGLSAETICVALFEPVARRLGDWWNQDFCADAEITVAMCRLRSLLRRLNAKTCEPKALSQPRAILVATAPGETHQLRLALDLEYFSRAGWDADCEFPATDKALARLVHDRWFDVLNLSLSSVFTRQHRLPELASAIQAARSASRNPALAVMVDGRIFFERPEYCVLVGADAACASAARVAKVAESLVASMQLPALVATQDVFSALGRRIADRNFSHPSLHS